MAQGAGLRGSASTDYMLSETKRPRSPCLRRGDSEVRSVTETQGGRGRVMLGMKCGPVASLAVCSFSAWAPFTVEPSCSLSVVQMVHLLMYEGCPPMSRVACGVICTALSRRRNGPSFLWP